ncbi:MAG: peptide chain release factor 2 [Rickettsiaceae bacterium H1]|nr:peptide chain release factor 2 [Rickettsiaceae bacterium H1]
MKGEVTSLLKQLKEDLTIVRRFLDPKTKESELKELQNQINDPEIWNEKEKAQKILKKSSALKEELENFYELEKEIFYLLELADLAEEDDDDILFTEVEELLNKLEIDIERKKTECLFSGEADYNDCFIEIHAGAGGTESNDWAEMIMRMYMRWAEIYRKFKVEVVSKTGGEEVGVKSVIIKLTGDKAYGWSKTEGGIHRLVRISPFDSNSKRHTSFASVSVSPITDESIDIEISDSDVRIDTYRASGAGGQHINKTDSAVRITHLSTGIVVQCQNNRSQHRNRSEAYQILRAKLYELELRKRESKQEKKAEMGWGQQIRSYVMQPYQMVKDLRTKHETGNVKAVLDGDIDKFIYFALSDKL